MPIEITMPRLSDTMESGTIIKWNVKEGDAVSAGDVVADIETDKATMEMQAFDDGTVARILVGEGTTVDIGTIIAVLAEEDESVDDAVSSVSNGSAATAPEATTAAPPALAEPARAPRGDGRVRVSPVARRLAEEHGVDLSAVQGSGPSGRIIKRDVLQAVDAGQETAAAIPPAAAVPSSTLAVPVTPVVESETAMEPYSRLESHTIPLSSMRQTIARRLVESKQTVPHYQVSVTFAMDALMGLRRELNAQLESQGVKLSVNDFLVRACALAMHEHPFMNASWAGDAIQVHGEVNVGIAISIPIERGGGLVVGTIRQADQRSLRAISHESRRLAEKARTRGLSIEELSDSTFTISNLGMFGVDHFTAIINPPNSSILAVGAAQQKPVVRDGELAVGWEMTATLSNDHRVVDGSMAARYLGTLRGLLETPAALLV